MLLGRALRQAGALPSAVKRKAFTARVIRVKHLSTAQRICPVLDLTLAPLDLNLLGLMVHLDRVHLTITANSNGGLLGSCYAVSPTPAG